MRFKSYTQCLKLTLLSMAISLCVVCVSACNLSGEENSRGANGPRFADVENMTQLPEPFTRRPQLFSDLRLKPGQMLVPGSEFAKAWTGKSSYRKLANGMVFEIPAQYSVFWLNQYEEKKRSFDAQRLEDLVAESDVGFTFFMPDFIGWTPDTANGKLSLYDPDWVNGVRIEYRGLGEEKPDAPGPYPPNVEARMKKSVTDGSSMLFGMVHDLTCYASLTRPHDKPGVVEVGDGKSCIGVGSYGNPVFLKIYLPPFSSPATRYPHIFAYYYTPEYGGLYITWRVSTKHVARWREIDAFVWRALKEWVIVNPYVHSVR